MKKFLSLLLALTLVLSLVVVPARAAGDSLPDSLVIAASSSSAEVGDTVTFSIPATTTVTAGTTTPSAPVSEEDAPETYTATLKSCSWSVTSGGEAVSSSNTTASYQVKATAEGSLAVSCTATYQYTVGGTSKELTTTPALVKNVPVSTFGYSDITLKVWGKSYTPASSVTVNLPANAEVKESNIEVSVASPYTRGEVTYNESAKTITVNATRTGVEISPVTIALNVTSQNQSLTIKRNPDSNAAIRSEQSINLAATYSGGDTAVSYVWTAKDSSGTSVSGFTNGTTATPSWKAPKVTADTNYTISCTATEAGKSVNATSNITVTVKPDNYAITRIPYINTVTPGNSRTLSFSFTDSTISGTDKEAALTSGEVAWSVSGTGLSASNLRINSDADNDKLKNKSAILTIPANCTAASCVVTAVVTKADKTYTVNYPITISGLSTTLSTSVANGSSLALYSNYSSGNSSTNLAYIAQSVLRSKVDSGLTVTSATIKNRATTGGTLSTLSSGANPYYTFTAYTGSLTAAEMTIVATAYKSSVSQGTYEIKLTIPVTPIMGNNFESVTAEPVSSTTTTTSYRVYFPTTYSSYYVINKTGSTPSSWSNSMLGTAYSSTTPYTLSSTDFNTNGTCTLYVVAKNGVSGNYYSGQMVVTQTNYNISYNGVAGETVQFAQSDFNDFMQSVSEARGDASKTKSYPYVTFDYVTFSLPTTSQGTLYYGGTAMSTSNSSGAFNTRTKVTNLDSVTFVPNAKTTAKTITLNFTLYATRYSSSSTSRGTTVSYSGSVVVNLVREDIKYTVSQGDSVRFDESDFLSYLRSTKGYTSNYTIDYVTFDQSAVSAVNEGSLYTYYNGYNYGGSVKTTDKFYYNAAASQNALSDVAFLASRYAKTGETVYIPFTIYARYGSTGTGTRQLTGTVAIKIGQTMNFIDVKTTDYFYNSVKWAVNKGVTTGTSSTTFSPYNPCKRAEIVTFLWRAAGSPEPTITRNPFKDVNAVTHSSYYKAILWASQKGIAAGTSTTTFSPDQVCTRAQIVTFLYRYAGKPSGYYSNPFKDVSATNEASYYNAILWASGKGITTGSSPTTFSPYASCNRAEAVTFLYRYTNGL